MHKHSRLGFAGHNMPYFSDLLPRSEPSRPLRSSGSGLLSVSIVDMEKQRLVVMHHTSELKHRLTSCLFVTDFYWSNFMALNFTMTVTVISLNLLNLSFFNLILMLFWKDLELPCVRIIQFILPLVPDQLTRLMLSLLTQLAYTRQLYIQSATLDLSYNYLLF